MKHSKKVVRVLAQQQLESNLRAELQADNSAPNPPASGFAVISASGFAVISASGFAVISASGFAVI